MLHLYSSVYISSTAGLPILSLQGCLDFFSLYHHSCAVVSLNYKAQDCRKGLENNFSLVWLMCCTVLFAKWARVWVIGLVGLFKCLCSRSRSWHFTFIHAFSCKTTLSCLNDGRFYAWLGNGKITCATCNKGMSQAILM